MIVASRNTVKGPGSAADGGGDSPWSNPNNILTDNGSGAAWSPGGVGGKGGDTLVINNFGFNIPSGAKIVGIGLTFDYVSTFSVYAQQIMIGSDSLGLYSQNKANFDNFVPNYGGPTDLWNLALTPAIVNNSTFSIFVGAGDVSGGDAYVEIDYVTMTVYWELNVAVAPANVPQRYDYKIYRPDLSYMGILPGVIKPFSTSQAINSSGAPLTVEVAATPEGRKPAIALGRLNRWLNSNWQYRNKFTVPKENVRAGAQSTGAASATNVPLYLDLSQFGPLFWNAVKSDGSDIRFTDQYGQQELPFELSNFNKNNRTGYVFYKAPAIGSDYDTDFYIYYGNANASAYAATDQYGSRSVWANYTAVYHYGTDSTLSLADASPVQRSLVNQGSMAPVAGKIQGGANAANSNSRFEMSPAVNHGTSEYTISTWFEWPLVSNGQWNTLVRGTNNHHHVIVDRGGNGGGDTGNIGVYVSSFGNTGFSLHSLIAGQHYLVARTISGTTHFYIDGIYRGSTAKRSNEDMFALDNYQAGGQQFGKIDETRITLFTRDDPYHYAEYASMQDTTTYHTISQKREEQAVEDNDAMVRNGNIVEVIETSYWYPNGKLKYRGQINRVEGSFAPEIDGTVTFYVHSDGRDLDNLVARGGPFAYTTDIANNVGNAFYTISQQGDKGAGYERIGQTFKPTASNLGKVQLAFNGSADVTLSIYTDQAGSTLLGSITKYVSVAGTDVAFEFGDFLDLIPGNSYFMTLSVGAGQSIQVYYQSGTNPYANGSMYTASYAGGSGGGSYGISTNNDIWFITYSGTLTTSATYTGKDPTTGMMLPIGQDYVARGGMIKFLPADFDATGLSLTAAFNTNTVYEAMDKTLDMAPAGFYYYVGLDDNRARFKRIGKTPDFLLIKGRHIEELNLAFSIENVINEELFSGGNTGTTNLYAQYLDAQSRKLYGPRLDRKSDNRVKIQTTADAIGKAKIQEFKDEQQFTTVNIMATTMNITDIRPGQLVAPRGFGSYIDSMLLQIVKIDYRPERVILQLGTLPLRFNQDYEDVVRGLIAEQTVDNPATPA